MYAPAQMELAAAFTRLLIPTGGFLVIPCAFVLNQSK
jgi:hypothetical protein